jgi:hypothetical protein
VHPSYRVPTNPLLLLRDNSIIACSDSTQTGAAHHPALAGPGIVISSIACSSQLSKRCCLGLASPGLFFYPRLFSSQHPGAAFGWPRVLHTDGTVFGGSNGLPGIPVGTTRAWLANRSILRIPDPRLDRATRCRSSISHRVDSAHVRILLCAPSAAHVWNTLQILILTGAVAPIKISGLV